MGPPSPAEEHTCNGHSHLVARMRFEDESNPRGTVLSSVESPPVAPAPPQDWQGLTGPPLLSTHIQLLPLSTLFQPAPPSTSAGSMPPGLFGFQLMLSNGLASLPLQPESHTDSLHQI